jgi:hypothetical protein
MRARQNLRNVADTGQGDGARCSQQRGRYELGRNVSGSSRWIEMPFSDKGIWPPVNGGALRMVTRGHPTSISV